jgi:hypothetical protein
MRQYFFLLQGEKGIGAIILRRKEVMKWQEKQAKIS